MGRIGPWAALGALVALCVGFLCWHSYARDDEDTAWLDPKQPPEQVAPPVLVPGAHGAGAPMACGDAFRGRAYPGSLLAAEFSVIGEI